MRKLIWLVIIFLHISFLHAQTNDRQSNLESLFNVSLISVTIGGDFIVTGSFPASITERVDQFITRMYNEARERTINNAANDPELLIRVKNELENYSFRGITLKRSTGEEINIDLFKFRNSGDFSLNPYLKNDDVIIFPPLDLERNFFSVAGAVNNPGKFHFVDGDKLSDALELAQGINKAYENVTTAEINRLSYDGKELNTIKVDIGNDFSLQRGDRIIITANETQKKEFSVTVVGEVNIPGTIPISKHNTTIKEVLEKAGGLREAASLKRARLFTGNSLPLLLEKYYGIRLKEEPEIIDPEISQSLLGLEKLMMYRMSNVVPEDTAYLFLENELRLLTEGSAVDFTKINDKNSEAAKYIVNDGDIIIIPSKVYTVYVFGQVPIQGHINYIEGKNYTYYINKAGGLGEYAEEDEIMIIKGVSRNWISPIEQEVKIEEGDYIWVPRIPARSFNYYVGLVGSYFGIVGSVATIILLLLELTKR